MVNLGLQAFGKPDRHYEGRPSEATLLAMITPENCSEDFHRPLSYFGNALHWAGRSDAPEAVVAKLLEVMIAAEPQGPWHPLKRTAFDTCELPLHEFAEHSTSEASVALVIAAYPAALNAKTDCGDTTEQRATPNEVAQGRNRAAKSSAEVKAMLASAETARGLRRIQTLAAEARARASGRVNIAHRRVQPATFDFSSLTKTVRPAHPSAQHWCAMLARPCPTALYSARGGATVDTT